MGRNILMRLGALPLSAARSRRGAAQAPARTFARRAQPDAHRAAARRQSARRLERHDDRGLRQCRRRVRQSRLDRRRGARLRLRRQGAWATATGSITPGATASAATWVSPTITRRWRAPRSRCGKPPATSAISTTPKRWVARAQRIFLGSPERAAISRRAADDAPLLHRVRTVLDQATPSANGTMVAVLAKLQSGDRRRHLSRTRQRHRRRFRRRVPAFVPRDGHLSERPRDRARRIADRHRRPQGQRQDAGTDFRRAAGAACPTVCLW